MSLIDNIPSPSEPKWLGVLDTAEDKAEAARKRELRRKAAAKRAAAKKAKEKSKSRTRKQDSSGVRVHRKGIKRSYLDFSKEDNIGDGKGETSLANAESKQEETQIPTLVICVNLGTTYSGAAYAVTSGEPGLSSIRTVKDWPKAPGHGNTEKTPTVIAFPSETPGLEKLEWGYDISKGRERHTWFKILFATKGKPKDLDDPLLQQPVGAELARLPDGMAVEEVLKKMYKLLFEHCRQHALKRSGLNSFDNIPKAIMITVPVGYGPVKREATKSIVESATTLSYPRDEIKIITESEAVCCKAVYEGLKNGDVPFRAKECILVLDIGGGSVDATTSVINKRSPPMFSEVCQSQCAYRGSTSVVRQFVAWCEEKFPTAFKAVPEEYRVAGTPFLKKFEEYMERFDNKDQDQTFEIPLPQLAKELTSRKIESHENYDFVEGRILLTPIEMRTLFEAFLQCLVEMIMGQTAELQQSQREAKARNPLEIRTLILAGGFALCEYIADYLRDFCSTRFQNQVKVVVPEDAWSATVAGGVLAGLFPHMEQFRKSRRCIGVVVTHAFSKDDDVADEYVCEKKGRRAKGYIKWLFKRGDRFKAGEKKRETASLTVKGSEPVVVFHMDLFAYDGNLNEGKPDRIDAPGVALFAKVQARYKPPKTFWKSTKWTENPALGTLHQVKQVDVKFLVSLETEQGQFKVEVKIGKLIIKTISFDFEPEEYR